MRAAVALLDPVEAQALTVSVAPAFATRWLLPRLGAFTAAHPQIALRVSTGSGMSDAAREDGIVAFASFDEPSRGGADLSIRFGRGHYAGLISERLFEAEVTPVCGPRLLARRKEALVPADLARFTLLHDDTAVFDAGRTDWDVWLAAAGVVDVDASRGPRFGHTGLALEAAEDGLGFALGITALTGRDVQAGRLIAPFAQKLRSSFAYHLVYNEALAGRDDLRTFRGWLQAEAAADRRLEQTQVG